MVSETETTKSLNALAVSVVPVCFTFLLNCGSKHFLVPTVNLLYFLVRPPNTGSLQLRLHFDSSIRYVSTGKVFAQ